jgi:ADP-dependent NAD(P)H-hydrate dehydratase / NAD(P)H-hydrate epimerase
MWSAPARSLSSTEMAVVEQNAVALGLTLDAMMENAGRAIAEEATRHLPPPPARVAVVASTGNNGGDGTCSAFYLHQWGYQPEIWMLRPPAEIRSRSAHRCFERVQRLVPIHQGVPIAAELRDFPLVLDAVLGTGQSGPLRSPAREAVEAMNASGAPVLAIDLPTGATDPHGLRPRWTVALQVVKSEMDRDRAGEVSIRDIGIPEEAWHRTGPGEYLFFPVLPNGSERGRRGRLVVIGGGPYSGAPALAALAALRSGAERATVLAPAGAAERIQSFSPNLIVHPFGQDRFRPTDVDEILAFVRTQHPTALLLGMGAGAHPETVEALARLERSLVGEFPMTVDADGLAGLPSPAEMTARDPHPVLVATPNQGEFVHYFGAPANAEAAERGAVARRAAGDRHLCLLVKGAIDLITDGESVFENRHHHVAMTVGGMGDVLGGVLASLLAQSVAPIPATRLATRWVGQAGLKAAGRRGMGLVATDVIDRLPRTLVDGLERVRPPG